MHPGTDPLLLKVVVFMDSLDEIKCQQPYHGRLLIGRLGFFRLLNRRATRIHDHLPFACFFTPDGEIHTARSFLASPGLIIAIGVAQRSVFGRFSLEMPNSRRSLVGEERFVIVVQALRTGNGFSSCRMAASAAKYSIQPSSRRSAVGLAKARSASRSCFSNDS